MEKVKILTGRRKTSVPKSVITLAVEEAYKDYVRPTAEHPPVKKTTRTKK
jgi:hypothetical protein